MSLEEFYSMNIQLLQGINGESLSLESFPTYLNMFQALC